MSQVCADSVLKCEYNGTVAFQRLAATSWSDSKGKHDRRARAVTGCGVPTTIGRMPDHCCYCGVCSKYEDYLDEVEWSCRSTGTKGTDDHGFISVRDVNNATHTFRGFTYIPGPDRSLQFVYPDTGLNVKLPEGEPLYFNVGIAENGRYYFEINKSAYDYFISKGRNLAFKNIDARIVPDEAVVTGRLPQETPKPLTDVITGSMLPLVDPRGIARHPLTQKMYVLNDNNSIVVYDRQGNYDRESSEKINSAAKSGKTTNMMVIYKDHFM